MIQDYISNIEAKIQSSEKMPCDTKRELLDLLSGLRSEMGALSKTSDEDARSIAHFTDASAHEVTRLQKRPELINVALHGLSSSVEGLESSHPKLVELVNRLAAILSNMGI